MALNFRPAAGMVLGCTFASQTPPEMTGWHRVIVVSPKRANRRRSCLVVPVSSRMPATVEDWHFEFPMGSYPVFTKRCCSKADLVTHVSHNRLNVIRASGVPPRIKISKADLDAIRDCIRAVIDR